MMNFAKTLVAVSLVAAVLSTGCSRHLQPDYVASARPEGQQASDVMNRNRAADRTARSNQASSGQVETVAEFRGPMPTGVTVSRSGRIFVNFPRWGDPVEYTVAEVKNGQTVAFPDADINNFKEGTAEQKLVSVQSVIVDPQDRLWMLDTAAPGFGPILPGGPKLVGVDLSTNKVFKTIHFPPEVALTTTYLNDVRFDLRRGTAGMAYITDSSATGPNGIIVVDLDSGRSWRRLHDHPSTKAEPITPTVEGKPFMERRPGQEPAPVKVGSDGIAISADGGLLFYCPLIGRKLYSVSVDALSDPNQTEEQVAKTVQDYGARGYSSDGLESDARNNLYLTDYEHNAIFRRSVRGAAYGGGVVLWRDELVANGPKLIWPDTLSVAADGYLYFTANQLNRQSKYNGGKDLRQKPYLLLRTRIGTPPVNPVK
jgi:sugar lactone lactonase YvrE